MSVGFPSCPAHSDTRPTSRVELTIYVMNVWLGPSAGQGFRLLKPLALFSSACNVRSETSQIGPFSFSQSLSQIQIVGDRSSITRSFSVFDMAAGTRMMRSAN